MINYIDAIKESCAEETRDSEKYLRLARMADNEDDRKLLIDIAKQELLHKAKLEGILLEYGEVIMR